MFKITKGMIQTRQKIIRSQKHIRYFSVPYVVQGEHGILKLVQAMDHMYMIKVFIIVSRSAVTHGVLSNFFAELSNSNIEYHVYTELPTNPSQGDINRVYQSLLKHGGDGVVAIGGGSVIDAAKLVSLRYTNPKLKYHHFHGFSSKLGIRTVKRSLPLFVAPTTAGSGSEVSNFAVMSVESRGNKISINSTRYLPKWIALDPCLMVTVPPLVTRNSGLLALAHGIESFLSTSATGKSRKYAVHTVRNVLKYLPKAMEYPYNKEVRLALADAALKGGLSFRIAGLGYASVMSRHISALYDLPEGEVVGVLLPYVLEFYFSEIQPELNLLATAIGMDTKQKDALAVSKRFLSMLKGFQEKLELPTYISSLTVENFHKISKSVLKEVHSTQTVPKIMDKDDLKKILIRAFGSDGDRLCRIES